MPTAATASSPTRRAIARPSAPEAAAPTGLTAAALPRTGVVLIGAARACRGLAALVAAVDGGSPVLAGWIDLKSGPTADDWVLPRLGSLNDLPSLTARFGLRCAVAMAPASEHARIRAAAHGTGLDLRLLPSPDHLLSPATPPAPPTPPSMGSTPAAAGAGSPTTTYQAPPSIDLGRLIGRTPHELDREAVSRVLTGKRILITGAGGSIGAELARVAATFSPESLILMERAENALFEIDRQTASRFPRISRRAVLHDVTDAEGTARLLAELRPHVVFHAAAHKHVPLMEDHPGHAITNNLFGTKSIADAAVAAGAERFVMISSDKAVNPTSVMGATKRLAEIYVRGLGPRAARTGTRLSMVRFGNVLGSACSVLTIWSTQLAEGASALTITDPRMTRYFMTIPEAATLVVQSMVVDSASSVGVFVLDMGDPIRIVDLAVRFVRAHGVYPRIAPEAPAELRAALPNPPPGAPTLDLVFTGARPGEKLHEELAYAAESLRPTSHPGVRTWAGPGFADADAARVQEMVAELASIRFSTDRAAILDAIRRHVPEMKRPA